jgi:hypothetical protein
MRCWKAERGASIGTTQAVMTWQLRCAALRCAALDAAALLMNDER